MRHAKDWVLILRADGDTVCAWRDYGETWGAATYTVLGYYTGRHSDALMTALALADELERAGGAS